MSDANPKNVSPGGNVPSWVGLIILLLVAYFVGTAILKEKQATEKVQYGSTQPARSR